MLGLMQSARHLKFVEKKLCINESSSNLYLLIIRKEIAEILIEKIDFDF
jgi:hypothetical protein